MIYTAEDLKNTKIRIESPEHSEYVQELVFSLGGDWGLGVSRVSNVNEPFIYIHNLGLAHGCNDNAFEKHPFKEIKIPMPDEKEWPQVGDEVEFKPNPSIDSWIKAKVLFVGNKHTILKSHCGREYSRRNAKLILREPKTSEQELRDELISALRSVDFEELTTGEIVSFLMDEYNITKK